MAEVSRTLDAKFGLSREKALYREAEIRRHFPEAWVDNYAHLIPAMTNHPKDRHVLAAAVHARAARIVTYNIRDFPASALAPYSITARGPSAFLKSLHGVAPSIVMQTLETQAAAINQPLHFLLSRLHINVPAFVAILDEGSNASHAPDSARSR